MMGQNSTVNAKGKIIGGGSPKDTSAGFELSRNATNSRGAISKTKENSPSASCVAEGHKRKNEY